MAKCIYCGGELICEGNMDAEDIWDEAYKGRLYSNFTCPECGAAIFAISPDEGMWAKHIQKLNSKNEKYS